MTQATPDEIQRQLDDALAERARLVARGQGEGERARSLTRTIGELAAALGLDPAEVADLGAHAEPAPAGREHPLHGDYRVLRRPGGVILAFAGLVLAAIVAGLEQPLAAAGLALAVVVLWVLFSARRVAHVRIGPSGELSLPGKLDPVSFSELVKIEFAYRYPAGVPEFRRAEHETIELRLHTARGAVVTLSRGPIWQIRPRRAPFAYSRLERFLLEQAQRSGMTVERGKERWTARR